MHECYTTDIMKEFNTDYRQPLVGDFMTKVTQWDGKTLLSTTPTEQELDTYKLRLKLCLEETFELFEAVLTKEAYDTKFGKILDQVNSEINSIELSQAEIKPVDIFDSLVDQDYVNIGFANLLGLDMKAGFDEVQKSNMSKLDKDGKPIFREDGKLLKSDQYIPPDLNKVYSNTKYIYGKE